MKKEWPLFCFVIFQTNSLASGGLFPHPHCKMCMYLFLYLQTGAKSIGERGSHLGFIVSCL